MTTKQAIGLVALPRERRTSLGVVTASLFGQFSVQAGDRQLGPTSFGGIKPKALLEILLLARGHLVSKDSLADALWPEARPKNVSATLETYVSVLRSKIFEDRQQARTVIQTASGAYRFALDGVELDVARFDELLVQAERTVPHQRRALWLQACELAHGFLLEDEPYAAWTHAPRELYRGRVARTHLLIAHDCLLTGDYLIALRHGEAALLVNPLAEEAFRVVMLANYALGYSEAARQAFLRCRETLASELELDPATETEDLASAIDAGAPPQELIDASSATGPSVARASRDRRDPNRRIPFLGRHEELARLHAGIAHSHQGRLGLILVEAQPGYGRTALFDQLQRGLRGTVGRASYTPRDGEFPALPLAGAVRNALAGTTDAAKAERYANAPWLTGAGDAVEPLLELLEGQAPLVLLLDDLHWADEDTFRTLEWLVQRAPHLRMAIVASARSSAVTNNSTLRRLSFTERILLGPLAETDAAGLRDVEECLVRATGGNPSLMADLWRWNRAGRIAWPPSLQEAVKRRVRGLGGHLPALLQVAARQAETFSVIDLARALETNDFLVEAELGQLCRLGVLQTSPAGYRFVEPIVRDVLVTTITPDALADRGANEGGPWLGFRHLGPMVTRPMKDLLSSG